MTPDKQGLIFVVVTCPVLISESVVGEANTSNIEHRESEEKVSAANHCRPILW